MALALLCVCSSFLQAVESPSLSVAQTNRPISRFSRPAGLEVSLFASEPTVRNPTDIDIDERGRVWVCEGVNYRSTFQSWGVIEPAGDRIVILEDTKGKGRADRETVFYQDPSINSALGICVLGNKVIVSDSPNVFVLTDTDGDGKADKRELLFTGIGGVDHDHGVHAFVFGPDGKLYFNMGNEGKQLFYPKHKEIPLHGAVTNMAGEPVIDTEHHPVNGRGKPYRMGMAFRCNLDGTQVETLAWNFRNNYELAVDSFGNVWQSDNDDDGNRGVRINYLMEHGNYGYSDEMTGEGWTPGWEKAKAKGAPEDSKVFYEWHQYDPGVVPDLLHTGAGSPTGMLLYEGKLLPEPFRQAMIHCDAGPRVVRAYPLDPDGAGFTASITNLMTTDDTWFRPSDACVAPDGSVFIADWNDAGVGGHNMADRRLETMTGRIYRVAPRNSKLKVPKLDLRSASGCIKALQSPNLSTRYLAYTRFKALGAKAQKDLMGLWRGGEAPMRARALFLLAQSVEDGRQILDQALNDSDANLRITALRIAHQQEWDIVPMVEKLAHDPDPQVRRQCCVSLRHCESPEAARLWAALAGQYDGKDRWYLEALGIGADGQWDKYLEAWLTLVGPRRDSPASREIIWRSRARKTPALLAQILKDKSLKDSERDHFFRSLDFINGPEKDAALVELLTTQ
jgi:putative membrane-bound dehydrogenase-like protein